MSIGNLLLSPSISKLIRGAILQSGHASSLSIFKPTAPNRQTLHANFISAVPACAHLAQTKEAFACLQNEELVDTATLRTAWEAAAAKAVDPYTWGPNIDGKEGLIEDLPSRLLEKGRFAEVPVMAGTTLDEGELSNPSATFSISV